MSLCKGYAVARAQGEVGPTRGNPGHHREGRTRGAAAAAVMPGVRRTPRAGRAAVKARVGPGCDPQPGPLFGRVSDL